MSDARTFCPRCGEPVVETGRAARPDATTPGRAEHCDECYFEEFELVAVPDRIDVSVCATCGAVHRGNRWVDVGAQDYTDVAIEEVAESLAVHRDATDVSWAVEPEQVDQNTIRMHADVTGVVRERVVEERVVVPVKISRQTCTRCGRIAGDYYAGTVQVRATDRTPTSTETERSIEIAERIVEEMEETGDRNAFITEVGEVDEGVDIRVSTNKIGGKISRRIVDEFGGSFDTAETLVTEDEDGNEVYRVAYAVRLPRFTPGDVIDPADDHGPVLVSSVSGNLKGRRLTTGERYEAPFDDADAAAARRLGTVGDARETTLVAVEDERAVQVLDPDTFQTETIARPDYLDPDAETVSVLKSRDGLYVLPTDAVERDGEDE